MALTVRYQGDLLMESYYIGDDTSKINPSHVDFIEASGYELTRIATTLTNIPLALGRENIRWYGDMAKFIVHNINLK